MNTAKTSTHAWWVCRKCGKKIVSEGKPGALSGGKCKKSTAGTHSYVKA